MKTFAVQFSVPGPCARVLSGFLSGTLAWLLFTSPFEAAALVHTWSGDANGAWSNAENWGNGVPGSSSALLFPQNADNKTNSNTIVNLETGSIHITGNAYRLGGSACYIQGGLSSTNATTTARTSSGA